MRLDQYFPENYTPGASFIKQILWYFLGSSLLYSYWLPFSKFKVFLLRAFGAHIGKKVTIKPGVRIKFPWRLAVGNYVWLGEQAWLDNLAEISIDDHVCISQGAYLGTGNHNWSDPNFALRLGRIHIQESSWVGAHAVVGPGVTVGRGAVLCLGSIATRSLEPMMVYSGNPAKPLKARLMKPSE